jgi:hypothetical protein
MSKKTMARKTMTVLGSAFFLAAALLSGTASATQKAVLAELFTNTG